MKDRVKGETTGEITPEIGREIPDTPSLEVGVRGIWEEGEMGVVNDAALSISRFEGFLEDSNADADDAVLEDTIEFVLGDADSGVVDEELENECK